jgi:drug/metabolite transporter (DMT)-like permease
MQLKKNLLADLALLLTTLIWGSTFVISKDFLSQWPPLSYLTFRFTIAAFVLTLLFAGRVIRAESEAWRAGIYLGLLIGVGFAIQVTGQLYTTPAKSAFITGLTTPLVPIVAFILFRTRPTFENLIGVILASIGGIVVLLPAQGVYNRGDLITVCCTLLFASHIALLGIYAKRFPVSVLSVLQIITAAMLFITMLGAVTLSGILWPDSVPTSVLREISSPVWNFRVIWQLLYLSIPSTVVTFLLWTWAQSRVSATHAAIIFALEPVFATFFAVAAKGRGEYLEGYGTIGAVLILAGVIVSEFRWRERQTVSEIS